MQPDERTRTLASASAPELVSVAGERVFAELRRIIASDQAVWGRPVGIAVAHDGALLVSEDGNDTIWRIAFRGENR